MSSNRERELKITPHNSTKQNHILAKLVQFFCLQASMNFSTFNAPINVSFNTQQKTTPNTQQFIVLLLLIPKKDTLKKLGFHHLPKTWPGLKLRSTPQNITMSEIHHLHQNCITDSVNIGILSLNILISISYLVPLSQCDSIFLSNELSLSLKLFP